MSTQVLPLPTKEVGNKEPRDATVDLIRILAMLMICVIHVVDFCGVLQLKSDDYFWNKIIFGLLVIPCVIAVNLYAILTGYLCVLRKWNIRRYVNLYVVVAFYSVVCYIPAFFLGTKLLDLQSSFLMFNPFTSFYWYFAAYSGLFVVIPFLNKGLREISARTFGTLLILVLFAYSALGCWKPVYMAQDGHNAIWLIIMYAVGAYIKLHGMTLRVRSLIGLFFMCCLVNFIALYMQGKAEWLLVWGYASISTTIASIAFFLILLHIKLNMPWFKVLLRWAAPMSFAVYLIHCHPFISSKLFWHVSVFARLCDYAWWLVPFISLVIYVVCTLVDWARIKVFEMLRMRKLVELVMRSIPHRLRELDS